MVRWIAVLTTVVFALAACDDNSGQAEAAEQSAGSQQSERSDQHQTGEPDTQTHRTSTGLEFATPADWTAEMMPAGSRLVPPETSKLRERYLLVIRFAPDGIDSAENNEYIESLADDFSTRIDDAEIATREENLESSMGPGAYVGWNVDEEGWTKRVGFFFVIDAPWMLVLRQVGPLDRVDKRQETLREIFASTRLVDAETDNRLVGTWRRARPLETDRGTYHEKITLETTGTLRLTHEPAGGEETDTIEDVGRWAVRDKRLVRYVGNQALGKIQMQTNAWSLTDDGQILEIQGKGNKTRWERIE
jgi:hypothetical protein